MNEDHDRETTPSGDRPGPSPETAPASAPESATPVDVVATPASEDASSPFGPPSLPSDADHGRNPVPIVPTANESGRALLTTGCIVLVISLVVSTIVGAVAGVTTVRWVAQHGGFGASATPARIATSGAATDEPIAVAAAVAVPSVVNIDVTSRPSTGSADGSLPKGHPDVPSGGSGSGVAFRKAPGGGTFILTNNHVVRDAASIVITPSNGEALKGTVVGGDPDTDIAVVRVAKDLPVIALGDSEKLVVGQVVVVIGSPFGLQHSVSSGVVSGMHRALPEGTGDSANAVYPLVDVIQTDAAINPGNSGGALVDRRGALVGISAAIYSGSGENAGIGFAIPVKTAVRIADELIATGKAKHPFLGIEGRTITEPLAKEQKLPVNEGALIERVFAGTGAAKAGLTKGDIITGLDGTPIRSMDDLILNVRRHIVGDTVKLDVWRAGSKTAVTMTVGDKPSTLK